jgi:hypothetical protein
MTPPLPSISTPRHFRYAAFISFSIAFAIIAIFIIAFIIDY